MAHFTTRSAALLVLYLVLLGTIAVSRLSHPAVPVACANGVPLDDTGSTVNPFHDDAGCSSDAAGEGQSGRLATLAIVGSMTRDDGSIPGTGCTPGESVVEVTPSAGELVRYL